MTYSQEIYSAIDKLKDRIEGLKKLLHEAGEDQNLTDAIMDRLKLLEHELEALNAMAEVRRE